MARRVRDVETASLALDAAERLVQTRGFNGFSYADIAHELGVTKPALHYHYASKAELGEALIDRYTERFVRALAAIDAEATSALAKLERYVALYREVLVGGRMCLCGMLAAEHETLPARMREAVVRYFCLNEDWLLQVLEQGRLTSTVRFDGVALEVAQAVIGALEGAMLIARLRNDVHLFDTAAARLRADLELGLPTKTAESTVRTEATRDERIE